MEPKGRVLDEIRLENGLTAYLYDQSRPVVGGRWQVQLLVYVPLEIKESHFQDCVDARKAYEAFTAAFGATIAFEQARTRNFIQESDVEPLLEKMKEEFLRSNIAYIAKPNFAEKYIRKRYSEWDKEQTCKAAHLQAVRRVEEEE